MNVKTIPFQRVRIEVETGTSFDAVLRWARRMFRKG
jgi:hypothetical protein